MKYSTLIIRIAATGLCLLSAGCLTAVDPVTGHVHCEDTINQNFAAYQQRATSTITTIQNDAVAKQASLKTAVGELQDRKNFIEQMVSPATTQPSSPSSTGISTSTGASVLFAVLGIALHTDNRRKDSAINASKVVKRTRKSTPATPPVVSGGSPGAPAPAKSAATQDQVRARAYAKSQIFPDRSADQNWRDAQVDLS